MGGGGGYAARLFVLFSFPCSADHGRDWPPYEVVFFGLATNTLNVRNNNNYQKHIATREISTCRRDLSAVFTMCYANAHAPIMGSTYTELARGPWVTGGCLKGYDRGPNNGIL